MRAHSCPFCTCEFTPTAERPAYPVKIIRTIRRRRTAVHELMCERCVDQIQTHGLWRLPDGGDIIHRPTRNANTNTSSCEGCGTFVALPEDKRRKHHYCSEPCRQVIYRRNAKPNTSSCQQCGEEFTARRGAKYCSPKCRQSAYRARSTA